MKSKKASGVILTRRGGNSALLRPIFEAIGIEPLEARSCAEAGQLILNPASAHLVMTDAVLPDGNWLDVLDLAAKAREKINVIVVSPRADIRLYIEVMNHGAFDFVTEEFTVLEFTHVIRQALDNARQARATRAENKSHQLPTVRKTLTMATR